MKRLKAVMFWLAMALRRYDEPTEPPPDEKPEVIHFWVAEFGGQKFMVTSSSKPDGGWF